MPFGRNLFIGVAIAAGVVAVSRVISKGEGGVFRTLIKNVMKGAMIAGEKLTEGTASLKENLEDLAAEARAEMKPASDVANSTKVSPVSQVSVQ